jgi:DNA-directed RNA polymerase sigma subunit (sigma70/sigma32)
VLSDEQERMLIQQAWTGDFKARRMLVASHMHLVVDFAKRNVNRGLPLLDLVREGTQGIVETLEKFDQKDSASFSTCAAKRIHHNIECAILNRQKSPSASHTSPPALLPVHNAGMRNGGLNERAA